MENTKVVVMGPADVAAMRKAHKEAEAAYFEAKVGAPRGAVDEMENTHEEYTLHQLCALTGLTPMEVAVQMTRNCRAASEAGVYCKPVRRGRRMTERKFVEILPSGELNPQSIMTVERWETTYRIPGEKNRR